MHRLYIERVNSDSVIISDTEQLHYLRDVLRLKIGDDIMVFDNAGNSYRSKITSWDKKQLTLAVNPVTPRRPSRVNLTIACAIPKGSRMDEVIDQLTQIGVRKIIPMITDRVVVKLDDAKKSARLERWEKIAKSAVAQSQRSDIPVIAPITQIEDVILNSQAHDLKLIPHLTGNRQLIRQVVSGTGQANILALIGPEGDFAEEEVELALNNGFVPVSLGSTVLRVATAAVAVASYLKFATDE